MLAGEKGYNSQSLLLFPQAISTPPTMLHSSAFWKKERCSGRSIKCYGYKEKRL